MLDFVVLMLLKNTQHAPNLYEALLLVCLSNVLNRIKAASKYTISRWIKTTSELAGIDLSRFN